MRSNYKNKVQTAEFLGLPVPKEEKPGTFIPARWTAKIVAEEAMVVWKKMELAKAERERAALKVFEVNKEVTRAWEAARRGRQGA